MNPRIIPSVAPSQALEFSESVIVTGSIGTGAKLKVTGTLDVKGNVEAGAEVTATGQVTVHTAKGPNTLIKSENGNVMVNLVLGDVKIKTPGATMIGVRMSSASANLLFGNSTSQPAAPAPEVSVSHRVSYDSDEDFSPRSTYM